VKKLTLLLGALCTLLTLNINPQHAFAGPTNVVYPKLLLGTPLVATPTGPMVNAAMVTVEHEGKIIFLTDRYGTSRLKAAELFRLALKDNRPATFWVGGGKPGDWDLNAITYRGITVNLRTGDVEVENTTEQANRVHFPFLNREIEIRSPEVETLPTTLSDYTVELDTRWGVVYHDAKGSIELYCGTRNLQVERALKIDRDKIMLTVRPARKTGNFSGITSDVTLIFGQEVDPERIWVNYTTPEDMENAVGGLTGKVRRGEVRAPMLERLLAERK